MPRALTHTHTRTRCLSSLSLCAVNNNLFTPRQHAPLTTPLWKRSALRHRVLVGILISFSSFPVCHFARVYTAHLFASVDRRCCVVCGLPFRMENRSPSEWRGAVSFRLCLCMKMRISLAFYMGAPCSSSSRKCVFVWQLKTVWRSG